MSRIDKSRKSESRLMVAREMGVGREKLGDC
jgi:hypothetical protein